MDEQLAGRRIVLLGIGHTNAHIVRMWAMNPLPDTELVCISDRTVATYSGMLPAVLAGQYDEPAMQIDLVKLCGAAGVRLLTEPVTGLNPQERTLQFVERPPLSFDALSIGIGSIPTIDGVELDEDVTRPVMIKPMQTFLPRLKSALNAAEQRLSNERPGPLQVVIVGSGAAGVEVAFCVRGFLQRNADADCEVTIVTSSDEILPGVSRSLQHKAGQQLSDAKINVVTGQRVSKVAAGAVVLETGQQHPADLVIWATGATAPPLLSELNLPTDDRGFLLTDATLRTTAGVPVFAVGDSGTIRSEHLPKAGVYAVRQGPVLWKNLKRLLNKKPLQPYQPQRSFLKLLNTGDGSALGEWKGFAFSGRWVMKLKDYIDTKFLKMYQLDSSMAGEMDDMQCRGCGCKLPGGVLDQSLSVITAARETLDDAAAIQIGQQQVLASTDFFTSPVEDPYLAGRIAALHSASDLIATGATIKAALANVVVPSGPMHAQQQGLTELLAGARREFETLNAQVVGGHTIVGSRWEIGFTVIGQPAAEGVLLQKSGLRPGDRLLLTKPLGIGILLAAKARQQCAARHYDELIRCMLEQQLSIAETAVEVGCTAATDVTGFGLAGHLLEMLDASGTDAELQLDAIPLLPGVAEAITEGIESSLFADNYQIANGIQADSAARQRATWKALFDPQTCGGLLLALPAQKADALCQRFAAQGRIIADVGFVTGESRKPQLTVR